MPKYEITLDISGTATVTIDAEDDEDAAALAQDLLGDAYFDVKVNGKKVNIEIGEVFGSQMKKVKT